MKHITRLRVHIAGTTVGELGTDARGRIYFQYDPAWLKTGTGLQRVAASCGIKRWREMLEQVRSATQQWHVIAAQEGVSGEERQKIGDALAEIDERLG